MSWRHGDHRTIRRFRRRADLLGPWSSCDRDAQKRSGADATAPFSYGDISAAALRFATSRRRPGHHPEVKTDFGAVSDTIRQVQFRRAEGRAPRRKPPPETRRLVGVAQEEAEEFVMSSASALRGVRLGAAASSALPLYPPPWPETEEATDVRDDDRRPARSGGAAHPNPVVDRRETRVAEACYAASATIIALLAIALLPRTRSPGTRNPRVPGEAVLRSWHSARPDRRLAGRVRMTSSRVHRGRHEHRERNTRRSGDIRTLGRRFDYSTGRATTR